MSLGAFIVRRLLAGVPTVVGVTLLTFLLFHVFGGNPVVAFLGKQASAEEIAALMQAHGFDQPLPAQYLASLRRLFTLDFGRSFAAPNEAVGALLLRGAGPSLCLTVPALLGTTVLALALALLGVAFRRRALDRVILGASALMMSVSFVVYIVLGQYLLAFEWPLFPIHGYRSGALERWSYLALPILLLTLASLGQDTRLYRAVLGAAARGEHVAAARARGLGAARILVVHVLRPALLPVVTRVMMSVPFLVTGSLLAESFFGIPGLGALLLHALDTADLPVIEALTTLTAVLFVLSNIATDILYAAFDPRVRP